MSLEIIGGLEDTGTGGSGGGTGLPALSAGVLVGRRSTLGGTAEEITVGANLLLTGQVLSAVIPAGAPITAINLALLDGIQGSADLVTGVETISLNLGAITPDSVTASGDIFGANLSGTNTGDQIFSLTGDVVGSGTSTFAATIAANAVTTSKIAPDAVTYQRMQNTTQASILLGRGSLASAGDVEEITLGAGLTMTDKVLSAAGGAGGGVEVYMQQTQPVTANKAIWLETDGAGDVIRQWYQMV